MSILVFQCSYYGYTQLPVTIPSVAAVGEKPGAKPGAEIVYWKEKIKDFRQKRDVAGEAQCLQQMGKLLYQLGNHSAAIEKLLAADRIYRSAHLDFDKDALPENSTLLGTVYYYNQQPVKAMIQFREALAIFSANQNFTGMANTYAAVGHMFEKQQRYDSAFHFQQVAMQFADLGKDLYSRAKINENIGSIYEDLGKLDSAELYFKRSLEQYAQTDNVLGRIEVINNMGDVYQKKGDYRTGLHYARQALALAKQQESMYQLQSAYRDIGQNFAMLKQYDSAYLNLEKSRALVQQIYTTETTKQVALQETLYDTEKKNAEIDRLQEMKEVNRLLNISAGILIILICLLGTVVISRQRLKIKVEKTINENNQETFKAHKSFMDSELHRKQLLEENLQQQLQRKSAELSSHILHLIQKNEVMESIKTGLTDLIKDDKRDQKKQAKLLLQKINFSFTQDSYWDEFRLIFDQVHQSFFTTLTDNYQGLTAADLRLLSLIKMNLNTPDIATLLGITSDSLRVNRYRVKKKLNLQQGESLTAFIQNL